MSSLKLDALAAVLLLKEKGTATAAPAAAMPPAQDAYEASLGSAGFATRFLAPLSFAATPGAHEALVALLQQGAQAAGIRGIVATSPRGVAALRAALVSAAGALGGDAATTDAGVQRLHALWSPMPVFVVGAASAAALHAVDNSDALAAAVGDIALRCGFHAELGANVTNGAELGLWLRSRWPALLQQHQPPPAGASSSSPVPHLHALVGDHRRDELYNVLAGRKADGQDDVRGNVAIVPIVEMQVYRTLITTEESERDSASSCNNSDAPSSFLVNLVADLEALATATTLPDAPLYIAFFSPSGVQTFFAQIFALHAAAAEGSSSALTSPMQLLHTRLAAIAPRLRFACIGQTSAQAIYACHASRGLAAPPSEELLVATAPNAETLLRCLSEDQLARPRVVTTSTDAATYSLLTPTAGVRSPSPVVPPVAERPDVHHFYKYHGTLNDYVLLDGFERHYTKKQLAQLAAATGASRRGAIGSDGLLYVTLGRERRLGSRADSLGPGAQHSDPNKAHVQGRMYMFNTDGSEAEMCGNGLRCVAKFVYDHKFSAPRPHFLHMQVASGPKLARIEPDPETGLAKNIALELGRPGLAADVHLLQGGGRGSSGGGSGKDVAAVWSVEALDVDMGNPQCVILLPSAAEDASTSSSSSSPNAHLGSDLDALDVPLWGQRLHDHARYTASHGTNVSFVSIRPPSTTMTDSAAASAASVGLTVDIRTFERGNGETWSCGSGISASCSTVLARRARTVMPADAAEAARPYKESVRVFVRGGELRVTCTLVDRPANSAAAAAAAAASSSSLSSSSASPSSRLLRDVLSVELCGPAEEAFEGYFPLKLTA